MTLSLPAFERRFPRIEAFGWFYLGWKLRGEFELEPNFFGGIRFLTVNCGMTGGALRAPNFFVTDSLWLRFAWLLPVLDGIDVGTNI